MGQREIMRARWAKEDPEFLKLLEEETERRLAGREIIDIRVKAGLSRSQFAALLRIDEEQLAQLEIGEFETTKEDTIKWINETLSC